MGDALTLERAGARVIGPRKTFFEPMGKHFNIFAAEILDRDRYTYSNFQSNYRGQNTSILSDSSQVISKQVWECLALTNKVYILWVSDNIGQEVTRKGAETLLNEPKLSGFIAMSLRKEEVRDICRLSLQILWRKRRNYHSYSGTIHGTCMKNDSIYLFENS